MREENTLSEIYKPQNPDASGLVNEIVQAILGSISEVINEFAKDDPDWFQVTIEFNNIKSYHQKFFEL